MIVLCDINRETREASVIHLMIDENISNAELMRKAKISANIIPRIKNGQYMALDKVESICQAWIVH